MHGRPLGLHAGARDGRERPPLLRGLLLRFLYRQFAAITCVKRNVATADSSVSIEMFTSYASRRLSGKPAKKFVRPATAAVRHVLHRQVG